MTGDATATVATAAVGDPGTAAPATGDELWATPAQRQAAARDAYRRSLHHDGDALTAAAVAAQFGRPLRWAQERIAEVRNEPDHCSDERSAGNSRRSAAPDGRSTQVRARSANHRRAGRPVPASRAARRFDTSIAVVVAVVAAAASYGHMLHGAHLAGEPAWIARAWPTTVDGLVLATSRSILRRRRNGVPVPFLTWFGFALGLAASLTANVIAADPGVVDPLLVRRLVAAWPPVALFITYETIAADHGELEEHP